MQTTAKPTNPNINNDLKEAFALWERKKGEKVWYSGKTAGDTPANIVAFVVETKKNPNQPDIQVYTSSEKDEEKIQLASLWLNEAKSGVKYYSGTTNEKEKLIAFINKDTQDGKYPKIRVYFKDAK